MANSDLTKKHWKIPQKYVKKLAFTLKNYKGNKKAKGYVRLKNLVTNKSISYENLKFIKNLLEKYKDDEQTYELNGGKSFEMWINNTLNTARKGIENKKKVKRDSGMSNSYIKNHEKDSSNGSKIRTPKLHKSTSINDINNNNVNYENIKITGIIVTENQVKKIRKKQ